MKLISGLLLLLSLLSFSFLCAIEIGEFVELESFVNGRSSPKFYRNYKNVRTQLEPGTVGKILELKKFQSGNYGFQVEILNKDKASNKVWIHYNPKHPRIKLYKENPLNAVVPPVGASEKGEEQPPKIDLESAKYIKTEQKEVVIETVPISQSEAKSEAVVDQVVSRVESINSGEVGTVAAIAPEVCADCNALVAGKGELACESVNIEVGNLKVLRSDYNGPCEINIIPKPELKKTWSREYRIYSDGHFDTLDANGVRGYYLFPRKNHVSYEISEDKKYITLQTSSSARIKISTETGRIADVEGIGSWSENPPSENGNLPAHKEHVQLSPKGNDFLIDLGYKKEGHPELQRSRSSEFKLASGKSCKFSNQELFDIGLGEASFKFASDRSLRDAIGPKLKKKCKFDLP